MAPKVPFFRQGSISVNGRIVGVDAAVSGAPVEFNRGEFDALLREKGYLVTWEKASICPNRPAVGLSATAHDINCSLCEDTGFVYFDACSTEMHVQAVRVTEQFWSHGRWDAGSILVTARPEFQLGYWDRITLKNGRGRFTELIRRVPGTADDRTKYAPLDVERVQWVDRAGALVVSSKDSEYVVTDTGVQWVTTAPDPDTQYSITYTYRPRYIVQELLHQIRESPTGGERLPFPVQAMAKLDFLTRDESRDETQTKFTDPFGSRR